MTDPLHALASLYGVEVVAPHTHAPRRPPSPEALFAVLRGLGANVCYHADVPNALRAKLAERAARRVPRVVGATADGTVAVPVRFFAGERTTFGATLTAEDGARSRFTGTADARTFARAEATDGVRSAIHRIPIASGLAPGYYTVEIEIRGAAFPVHAIVPPREHALPAARLPRVWGVFAPLHALRTAESLGTGDLHDLARLVAEVFRRGGRVVGAPPLLASHPPGSSGTDPWLPSSRLYLDELFLDLHALVRDDPTLGEDALGPSSAAFARAHALDRSGRPEVAAALALRRPIVARAAERFFASPASEGELERARAHDPFLETYARFRATLEAQEGPFHAWPARLRAGAFEPGDYDEASFRTHVFAQLRLREQLDAIAVKAREGDGLGLYLELPRGVHAEGFDAFLERGLFAPSLASCAAPNGAGAPDEDVLGPCRPDAPLAPLLVPEAMRADGYAYLRRALAVHMRSAGILRVDAITASGRALAIPAGMDATEGVVVRYPGEEIAAVLAIEAHRHGTTLASDASVTKSPEAAGRLAGRGVGMHRVVVAEMEEPPAAPRRRAATAAAIASVTDHDHPTFAAFVACRDIDAAEREGRLDAHEAREARARRHAALAARAGDAARRGGARIDTGALHRSIVEELGASEARVVLVALEDLWLEERPGPSAAGVDPDPARERPLAHALSEAFARADVAATLGALDDARRSA